MMQNTLPETPLVSIIIPCYNAERYVGEAIESALAQTYPNKEVILIDDGSTDGSLDVIRSFGEAIRWETGPNRGGSAARNRGLALARGELIQFLDADDLLHPQKLERQVRLSLEDPKAIVYCDYVVQDIDSGQVLEIPKRECEGLDPVVFAIRAERLQTSAPLHRKAALLEIGGFDESLPCAQEYDLHIRLACHGYRWRHLREVLYTLRRRKNSVSSDYARVINIHPRIMRRAREILVEPNEWTEIRAEEMAGKLAHGARVLLRLNRVSEARRLETEAAAFHWSAGLRLAYSSIGRLLRRLIGPIKTEKLREWAKWARVVA